MAKIYGQPIMITPEIYRYRNYREYLQDWFEKKRQTQKGFSGSVFAKRAGLQSHNLLPLVIRGKRNLGYSSIRAFIRGLSLRGRSAVYFEKLVLLNQATDAQERQEYSEELAAVCANQPGSPFSAMPSYRQFFRHWYWVAIRELVALEGFKPDPKFISAALRGWITTEQAAEAWKGLQELGFVSQNKSGRYEIVHGLVDIAPGQISKELQAFHREYLQLAQKSIDLPLSERELSSATFLVDADRLEDLRERINMFRRQILLEFQRKGRGTPARLSAVNVQLLLLNPELEGERK